MQFLVLLFAFFYFSGNCQVLKYDVILMNDTIGHTEVEKKDSLSFCVYKLKSHTKAKFLFKQKHSDLNSLNIFKNGVLQQAIFRNVKEDETIHSSTVWDANQYHIKTEKGNKTLNQPIHLTTVQLYFAEPKTMGQIYSERLGSYVSMVKIHEGYYKCEMDNNMTIFYKYQKGKLIEIEMKKGFLGSVFMRLSS